MTALNVLSHHDLVKILTEPKNSLVKQYTRLFEIDGITLKFDEQALELIVDKAVEFKLGARGLRSICEFIMTDAMFELPSDKSVSKITISLNYAEKKLIKSNLKKLKVA